MRVQKCYYVFDRHTGQLVASLPWSEAVGIYGDAPAVYLAYRVTKAGKLQVKHLCSGLDANATENAHDFHALKAVRRAHGITDQLPR